MSFTRAYTATHIFTGEQWLRDYAVMIEDKTITEVLPLAKLPAMIDREVHSDCIIAPAFIDLQIYGAYGKLFANYPEADALFKLNEYCRNGGAAYCLPTIATNSMDVFLKCIEAVRNYWNVGGEGILGLHLEGPWLNPNKRGAHIESLIHPPSISEVKQLLDFGKDVIRMVTLAPEVCSKEILELILDYGIVISAGHSDASYEEAMEGFENGIRSVTHLYNAMSPLHHRKPGLVGAAMDHARVMASIIPDGYHVDYPAIRIAKNLMKERLFVITDAVTESLEGYYKHTPVGDKYESSGILSGSALTMVKALKNLVENVGIEAGEAMRMCSLYPARLLGMENKAGMIRRGYPGSFVILDADYSVRKLVGPFK